MPLSSEAEIEELRHQVESLRAELAAIHRSRSWRLVLVIRRVMTMWPRRFLSSFPRTCFHLVRAGSRPVRRTWLRLVCMRRGARMRRILPGLEWRPGVDVLDRLGVQFAHHRSGWTCAVDALGALNRRKGVPVDVNVEQTFAWKSRPSSTHGRPWIGICHVPSTAPEWLPSPLRRNFFPSYSRTPDWECAVKSCVGLFALSEAHAAELRRDTGLPVCVLMHPTETPSLGWTMDAFLANREKKIIQVGWWLRRMHAIHRARLPGYQKVLLELSGQDHVRNYFQAEEKYLLCRGQFNSEMQETVTTMPYVTNREYDTLLSENVVFLDLYGSSANNAIIECVVRRTPLLVNRLPAVVEYLGESYPLYYSSYEEATEKASSRDLLYQAHLHLQAAEIRDRLRPESFLRSFMTSDVYLNLH